MRKLLLGALLLLSTLGFSQVNLGGYYGTENTLGFEVIGGSKIIIGGGVSFKMSESNAIGSDYTEYYWDFTYDFPDQVNNGTVEQKTFSLYGVGGYQFKKYRITGRLGYGGKSKYTNYYDPSRIFGSRGYYFRESTRSGELLIGTTIGVQLAKKFYFDLGYDTYNKCTIGLSYEIF